MTTKVTYVQWKPVDSQSLIIEESLVRRSPQLPLTCCSQLFCQWLQNLLTVLLPNSSEKPEFRLKFLHNFATSLKEWKEN